MRVSFHALAVVAVLTAAVPASALTVQPASTTAAASTVRALFSSPSPRFVGADPGFRESIAGDSAGVSGLPVYFEPTDAGAEADEARYAADPARFVARANAGEPAATAARAPSTAAASKAPLNGR